ncbi:acyl-CoA dehydrogenase family protein [Pseudomonas sp. NPDC007930]|uniref:acyl-CoA dehydrogenase family protein n=1 Tax=Pseudomonas sp. NPDC007930 TaxID=3364417 RepID=UPI0036E9D8C4
MSQCISAADAAAALASAERLAAHFASTAVARDKAGGNAHAEVALLRDSGLLTLLIAREHGGQGAPWSLALEVVRRFARVDGSLAHLFGYHFLDQLVTQTCASPEQFAALQRESAKAHWFWGNALNSLDRRVLARREAGGYRLNGVKQFTSGSPYADRLVITFRLESDPDTLLRAVIRPDAEGLRIHNDWDAIGQRQTGSGTVSYDQVWVSDGQVLSGAPVGAEGEVLAFNTLGPILAQLVLTQVFLGSAEGALAEAARYTREQSRPWHTAGVERAEDDPLVIRQYGEFAAELEAFRALAERASAAWDQAFAQGLALSAEQRGHTGLQVAAANVFGGRVALGITSRVFEVMGARATASRYGHDRFWRNVRTHTLHNPAEYKLLTLGRHALKGELPVPGFYA